MKRGMLFKMRGTPRQRLWQRTVPPVRRRGKLWTVRGRLSLNTGYYSPFDSVGLPQGRKPRLVRVIHTIESREGHLDA